MAFVKYTGTNLAIGQLLGGISNSSGTLILATGQGGLFPSVFPFKLKIEQFDAQSRVIKREIVKCTNRVGDTFTITRSHEACPADYSAVTQTTTAFAFNSGDTVSLAVTADAIDDIQDEVEKKLSITTYDAEKLAFAATSSGSDTYAATVTGVTAYNNGQTFKIQADVANTGAATLNINSLGAKTIKKLESGAFADLATGDIIVNQIFFVTYNSVENCFQFSADPATATIPQVGATKSTFVAGENLTAGDAVYVSDGTGSRTSGRVYKADANDGTYTDAVRFIGFATDTITTGNNIKIDTAGVNTNQTGLTIGAEYFVSDTAGAISTTPGTTKIYVGRAVSATGIHIDQIDKKSVHSEGYAVVNYLTTSGNNDLTITCGFRPKIIHVFYYILGRTSAANVGLSGDAVFSETTCVINKSFDYYATSNVTAINSTAPTIGTNSSGDNISMTLSIASISSTGFVLRRAAATSGSPSGTGAAAYTGIIAYR